jgi:hypothetical protein
MVVAGFMAPVACLLAGCSSSGGDLISTVALPSQQSVAAAESDGFDVAPPHDGGRMTGVPNLTENQRGYLDDLLAAGVHPANDLRALSIGAYVCQARAAGQSDQAVWDSVARWCAAICPTPTAWKRRKCPTTTSMRPSGVISASLPNDSASETQLVRQKNAA